MAARARIVGGICGFATTVVVRGDVDGCTISIESDCPMVQRLADQLPRIDPLREVAKPGDIPLVWRLAAKNRLHAACPVPVGILKAIELEAGLALPAKVSIDLSRETEQDGSQ